MKRRKIKKKKLFLFILTIGIIFLIIFLPNKNSSKTLKSIGYSDIEIKELKKLTTSETAIILNYDYNSNLVYMVSSENYDSNKLESYLKYTLKYNNIDYNKIFDLINHEEFKEDKMEKYISLLNKYNNIVGILKYVNNYYDKNLTVNETTLDLISQKYFILDFLDRYIKYYNNNTSLELKEIITRVNANLDHTFYVDVKPADISKGIYTLINKYNYLDKNYVPDDLTSDGKLTKIAFENFTKMANAVKENGLTIKITTAYRSYNFQATLYNNYVAADGVKAADTYSARPGYSEHQLGYSTDLTNASNVSFDEFENTKEYEWLKDNAHKYGFILRYPKGKEYITGYQFEPWHYRYIGVDIATYIYENDLTYEEYYAYFLR